MAFKDYTKRIPGKKKGEILLFALSTCGWCKKTRKLLDNLGIEYSYVYVDLLDDDENEEATKEVARWNPRESFPVIVINNKRCIVGYQEDEIRELAK